MNVLIFYQRRWARVFAGPVSKAISLEFPQARFSALVMKQNAYEHIKTQQDLQFENIWLWDKYLHSPDEVIGERQVSLNEVCDFLGIDGFWENMQALRAHVRDYGKKYYYAYYQAVPDEHLRKIVIATYLLIKEVHEKFRPDVIITPNFVGLQHLFFMHYCRKYNIYIRGVTDSRFDRKWFLPVGDELDGSGPVHEVFHTLLKSPPEQFSEETERMFEAYRKGITAKIKKSGPAIHYSLFDRLALKRIAVSIYRMVKPKEKFYRSVTTGDNSGFRIAVRDHMTHFRNVRAANQMNYDELPNAPFFFFPLQFQPEQTIDVFSPYFNNQIETARLVAMSLPRDTALVVKEHPAMVGYRSISYLEKIKAQPNISLVDYRVSSAELISKSLGVISPGGTAILEAGMLGKKALQLGDNALYLPFPHVMHWTHMRSLRAKLIEWFLEQPCRPEIYHQAIKSWMEAVREKGFNMDYISAWETEEKHDISPYTHSLLSDMKKYFK